MAYITQELELYIPKLEDLWFYQQMTSDPETMSYNANWDVDYDGYHRDTGCIDHPDETLADWYDSWDRKRTGTLLCLHQAHLRWCMDRRCELPLYP